EAATVTVSSCTFTTNHAGTGGALMTFGRTFGVTNSTFSDNSATKGGGIANDSGTLTLTNSTLSGNSATSTGGNIYTTGDTTMNNNIVANADNFDVANAGTLSGSNNVIETGTGVDSLTGTIAADPNLDALADNGGPTQTFALLDGSPALDAGDP